MPGFSGSTDGETIQIAVGWPPIERLAALLHELAHVALGHDDWPWDGAENQQRKIEAESASYLLMRQLGHDPPSSEVILSENPITAEALRESLDRLDGAVDQCMRDPRPRTGRMAPVRTVTARRLHDDSAALVITTRYTSGALRRAARFVRKARENV